MVKPNFMHDFSSRFKNPISFLLIAFFIYIVLFAIWNVERFQNYAYVHDIEIFEQTIYQTTQGHFMANSYTPSGSHFNDQVSLVMLLPVPFYALFPWTATLLTITVVVIACGALALFFFARDMWGDRWAALFLALAYLLHPVIHGLSLNGFQELKFALPLFILFIWQIQKQKNRTTWILFFLLITTRQDITLITVFAGLYIVLFQRRYKLGLTMMLLSVAYLYFATKVLMGILVGQDYWANSWHINRFVAMGDNAGQIIAFMLKHPLKTLALAFDTPLKAAYLPAILVPLLATPLLGWSVLWIGGSSLAMNLLSSFIGQHFPFSHYASIFVGIAFASVVVGLNRSWFKAKPARLRIICIAMMAACAISILFNQRPYSFLSSCPDKFGYPAFKAHDLALLHNIETSLGPKDSLVTSRSLASHFGKRDKLLHIIHDPKIIADRNYDYILWDRQVPTFIPPEEHQQLIQYLTENFVPVVGSGVDRIILFKKKR